jgi:hypothetical protein
MEKIADKAFVSGIHEDVCQGILRINLKWRGDHDISAFDLDRLGNVMYYVNETENTGWVIIQQSHLVKPGDGVPLRGKTE